MASDPQNMPFSLLPDSRPPWKEFVFSMVTQGGTIALLVWVGIFRPQILTPPARDYHAIALVSTPPPVNHQPAPIRVIEPPKVVAQLKTIPDNLRLVAPKPKPQVQDLSLIHI